MLIHESVESDSRVCAKFVCPDSCCFCSDLITGWAAFLVEYLPSLSSSCLPSLRFAVVSPSSCWVFVRIAASHRFNQVRMLACFWVSFCELTRFSLLRLVNCFGLNCCYLGFAIWVEFAACSWVAAFTNFLVE